MRSDVLFDVNLPLSLAQISSGSRHSECAISHGSTHESQVVYRHSLPSIALWETETLPTQGATSNQTSINWWCVYYFKRGHIGHSWSSLTRVRARLSSDATMALAAGTAARTRIDAVAADKFKAVIRETAANAAQTESLKRARGNADDHAPRPAPSAPLARKQTGTAAAFSRVVAACVGMIRNSRV